jgi:hypothetical protein
MIRHADNDDELSGIMLGLQCAIEFATLYEDGPGAEPIPPPRLFHFTDCDGAIGILRTKRLWASLATTLNDSSEIQYAVDRSHALVQKQLAKLERLPRELLLERLVRRSGFGEGRDPRWTGQNRPFHRQAKPAIC